MQHDRTGQSEGRGDKQRSPLNSVLSMKPSLRQEKSQPEAQRAFKHGHSTPEHKRTTAHTGPCPPRGTHSPESKPEEALVSGQDVHEVRIRRTAHLVKRRWRVAQRQDQPQNVPHVGLAHATVPVDVKQLEHNCTPRNVHAKSEVKQHTTDTAAYTCVSRPWRRCQTRPAFAQSRGR